MNVVSTVGMICERDEFQSGSERARELRMSRMVIQQWKYWLAQ